MYYEIIVAIFCISYILWLGSLIIIYILWICTIKEAWFITEATLLIIFFFCMFLIYENRNLYFSVYINWKSQQVFSFPLFLKLFDLNLKKNLQRISSIGSSPKVFFNGYHVMQLIKTKHVSFGLQKNNFTEMECSKDFCFFSF